MKSKEACFPHILDIAIVFTLAVFFVCVWRDISVFRQSASRLSISSLFLFRSLFVILAIRIFLLRIPEILDSPNTLWILALGFFVWMLLTKWMQHLAFQTHSHDVGLFHSTLWNALHGTWMVDSLRGQIYFADHLIFFLVLLIPFYWLHAGPETLFVLSALAFALGMVGLYWLSLERLRSRSLALLLALTFGLHRYLWGAFLHEFHPDFFAPFFYFLLFLGFYKKHNLLLFSALFMILMLKEDYAFYLIPIGIYFYFSKEGKIRGAIVIAISILYAVFAFSVLVPFFYHLAGKNVTYPYLGSWAHLGSGFGEILKGLFLEPSAVFQNLAYRPIFNFAVKFLFLPLLSPLSLVYLLPPLFLNASSQHPLIRNLSVHYGLIPAALALIASLEGLRNLQNWLKRRQKHFFARIQFLVPALACCLIAVGLARYPIYKANSEMSFLQREQEMLVTKNPLCVQSSLFPHLIPRGEFSIFPECSKHAQFLLVLSEADTYPLSREEFEAKLEEVRRGKDWRLSESWGNLTLFEATSPRPKTGWETPAKNRGEARLIFGEVHR